MRITPLILSIFILLISACQPTSIETPLPPTPVQNDVELKEIPLDIGYGVDGGWYELYFTDPVHPDASSYRGGPDRELAEAINNAKLSVDLAVYSMSLWSIRDALLDALHRGVEVRLIMESGNMDRSVPQELLNAGIVIVGDRGTGLMHDKFVIIDRSELWIGSMNFTVGSGYEDNNNLIRLYSSKLIENYQTEFDEMFVGDHFGEDIIADTPNPSVYVNGTLIETYFSPDDGVSEVIVELINNAQESIFFMAFSFTSDPISEALLARAQEGVIVAGVMDDSQIRSNQGGEFDVLAQAGLDIRKDGIEGLMHHKVFIIDERIVIMGSYNFSKSAEERNDENIIVVYNSNMAKEFLKEFDRVQEQAEVSLEDKNEKK